MWNWLRGTPRCPLNETDMTWLESRFRQLLDCIGLQRLRGVEVVLPVPAYFPDPFDGGPEAVRLLLDRVCGYAGVDPAAIDMEIYRETMNHGEYYEAGMETGCMFEKAGDRFKLWVEASHCADPLGLVAVLARELTLLHLLHRTKLPMAEEEQEAMAELGTICRGLGVFTANAAIHERYWHEGDRGNFRMEFRGALALPMYGYALALFAWLRGEKQPAWAKELRRDVRTPFTQGLRYLQETPDAFPHSG